ncbi:MAG: N-acetylmuramic acid 6-phosphate etherase [Planctomycetaceae bacterium]
MLEHLTTEARNPASASIDQLSAFEIAQLMNSEDAGVSAAIGAESERIAAAIRLIADRLRDGGRLVYLGAGTSGRLGVLDAAECPPTFSTPPELVVGLIAGGPRALTRAVEGAEDHPAGAEVDLAAVNLSDKDAVVGIATSGRTPYVLGGLKYARSVGALAVGLSCNRDSDLSAVADVTICPVVGPEVISGSTRLKAGTATKLVLNTLSTGAMVLLGKTYGNLMVDLRATNSKLLDRSRRIVAQLTDLSPADAETLLGRCGGEVKTAVVAHFRNVAPDEARRLLEDADGHLRRALEDGSLNLNAQGSRSLSGVTPPDEPNGVDLVLGVDGGGSKTVAWLARRNGELQVLGSGVSGPSNPRSGGIEAAAANLEAAICAAWADAKLEPRPVAAVCLALAGTGRLVERTLITDWASARNLAAKVEVVPDAEPVLATGTPEGWGVAVIAGTGSLAVARGPDGQSSRSGGWGELFGDEGSGYAVTIAALRAAAKAADGRGPETLLLSRLMARLKAVSPAELVTAVHLAGHDRRYLASLAIEVIKAAEIDGDAVARTLLDTAAADLTEMVRSAAEKAGLSGRPFPLAVTGGLALNAPTVREKLVEKLRAAGLTPDPVSTVTDPVRGAVLRARSLASGPTNGD